MKPKIKKKRLDLLLTDKWPDLSRSRIQAEIMAGNVFVNDQVVDKPGTAVDSSACVELRKTANPYVSRGGLKLAGALEAFSINVENLVILDVGASTGGFTDCLLRKGARLIYALDVGYGQLDYSLRSDPRVVVMERFNIRDLKADSLEFAPDLAVVDVSFISLLKVLPVLYQIGAPTVLALVKPQFEAGRADADKGKGVIRNPVLHREILENTALQACKQGYCTKGVTYSRWPGPKGNIEYFNYFTIKSAPGCTCAASLGTLVEKVVEKAHLELNS